MLKMKYTIEGPEYSEGEVQKQIAEKVQDEKPIEWDRKYIEDLEEKRRKAKAGGGEKRVEAQHVKGKLTARERVEYLFDEGSFQEVGAFIESRFTEFGMQKKKLPGDGVITGFGTINGEPVYAAVEDFTVMGGTYGEYHSRKIVRILLRLMTAAEQGLRRALPDSTDTGICFCGIQKHREKFRKLLWLWGRVPEAPATDQRSVTLCLWLIKQVRCSSRDLR